MWQDGCDSCSHLELDHLQTSTCLGCVGYDGLHIHHGTVYPKNDSIFAHLSAVGISIFHWFLLTLLGTNISLPKTLLKTMFVFPKVKYDEICWSRGRVGFCWSLQFFSWNNFISIHPCRIGQELHIPAHEYRYIKVRFSPQARNIERFDDDTGSVT